MSIDRVELLRAVPFFGTLTPGELAELAAASEVRDYAGQVLLQRQNAVPESLFVLLRGTVELTAREDQDTATVGVLQPHSVFTLAAVLADMPTASEARTTRRSQIAVMPAERIRALVDGNHAFCKAAMLYVVEFSRVLLLKLHTQKMRNTTERLALWILENRAEDGMVEIPFEKRTLASILGTTPENLSRSFSLLDPIVRKKQFKRYQVTDTDALAKIARPSPILRTH